MWFLSQNILLYKFNAFSFLALHLPCTVLTISSVWGMTANLAWIPFSFFTISLIEDWSLLWILAISAYKFFSSLLSKEFLLFQLKEALYSFSLVLSSVWLCDPMDCSITGFPVLHCLLELAQTLVRWVGDAIQLIICRLLFLPSIFPSIRVFSNESVLHVIGRPEYWCFSFIISLSSEYSELISSRIDWLKVNFPFLSPSVITTSLGLKVIPLEMEDFHFHTLTGQRPEWSVNAGCSWGQISGNCWCL